MWTDVSFGDPPTQSFMIFLTIGLVLCVLFNRLKLAKLSRPTTNSASSPTPGWLRPGGMVVGGGARGDHWGRRCSPAGAGQAAGPLGPPTPPTTGTAVFAVLCQPRPGAGSGPALDCADPATHLTLCASFRFSISMTGKGLTLSFAKSFFFFCSWQCCPPMWQHCL